MQSKHLYYYLLSEEIEYLQALQNPPPFGTSFWSQSPPLPQKQPVFRFLW